MFSFHEVDGSTERCCRYQTFAYMKYGQANGLSPLDYYQRLTNFSNEGKKLVFIMSKHVPDLCLNVITHIGFGHGQFRMYGRHGHALGIFLHDTQTWHIFHHLHVSKYLTYEWFKHNVICRGQPWICANWPN
ncbi:uncharacterized protein LOC142339920 [Convolutriloba macropyga]|uniref:uncharacterized protein LOC142339920 n=1 Tax=Convolutriloba macropyga TaxID=536237 RepID=UPI003F5259C7